MVILTYKILRGFIFSSVLCFTLGGASLADEVEAMDLHKMHRNAVTGIEGYTVFNEPLAGFFVEVPKNWETEDFETTDLYSNGGRIYVWIGPDSSNHSGFSTLGVTVVPVSAAGVSMASLEQYSEILKNKILSYEGEILNEQRSSLNGQEAFEIIARYPSLATGGPEDTTVSNRKKIWMVTRKGDYYVQIVYSAEESDYDASFAAYTHAKETFR